jgi:hypothetical protein
MSKGPKQTHLEYLFATIKSEQDQNVSRVAPLFEAAHSLFEKNDLTETQLRNGLEFLTMLTVSMAENRYRTNMLLNATTDYIIDPNHTID